MLNDDDARQVTGARAWHVEYVEAQDVGPQLGFTIKLNDFSEGNGFTFEGIPNTYDYADGWDASNVGELVT